MTICWYIKYIVYALKHYFSALHQKYALFFPTNQRNTTIGRG